MSEYMHLIGAEQVQSAANVMRAAADEMSRAATSIEYTMQQHQRFMEDWLQRLEAAAERISTRQEPSP